MKKSIKYILPVVLLVLASTGCKKELNDAAVNNNQPSTVTPSVMLTSSEATLGFVLGGDLSRFEGLFDQQKHSRLLRVTRLAVENLESVNGLSFEGKVRRSHRTNNVPTDVTFPTGASNKYARTTGTHAKVA